MGKMSYLQALFRNLLAGNWCNWLPYFKSFFCGQNETNLTSTLVLDLPFWTYFSYSDFYRYLIKSISEIAEKNEGSGSKSIMNMFQVNPLKKKKDKHYFFFYNFNFCSVPWQLSNSFYHPLHHPPLNMHFLTKNPSSSLLKASTQIDLELNIL